MKNCIALICIAFMLQLAVAQQPYYDDVDLSLTGQDLYDELQAKIDISNNTFTYGDVRDVVKITDEDPSNANNLMQVFLVFLLSCHNYFRLKTFYFLIFI